MTTATKDPPKTKPSTPRLSEVAKRLHVPSGIVKSAWPSVAGKLRDLGIGLDEWQKGIARLALGKREDGWFAATVGGVVLSIPRQTGKTYLLAAIIFALCLLHPKMTVLWTSHRLRTSNETFLAMLALSERSKVAPFMLEPRLGSGEQVIRFSNGSRILIGARERGFGRGFAQVDIVVLDEAQILTERAVDDMIPAANQSTLPGGALLFYTGTPPKPEDPSEVFVNKRTDAIGGDEDTLYVEMGAERGSDPDDWGQIARANPSYPLRTPKASILRMRKNLSTASFLREAMGIWDDDPNPGPFAAGSWRKGIDADSRMVPDGRRGVAVDVAWDRSASHILVAGERPGADGWHVEVMASGPGTAWVIPWLQERCGTGKGDKWADWTLAGVAVQEKGAPVSALVPAMKAAGIPVVDFSAVDLAAAWGRLYDLAKDGRLWHRPHETLDKPAARGATRKVGAGALVDRKLSLDLEVDAAPILAASGAVWLVSPQPDDVTELTGSLMA